MHITSGGISDADAGALDDGAVGGTALIHLAGGQVSVQDPRRPSSPACRLRR
jgi:hypothetical protein